MKGRLAVLFDMDGVLVDTEELKAETHSACIASFSAQVSKDLYSMLMGQSFNEVASAFIKETGLKIDAKEYKKRFNSIYRKKIDQISKPNDGCINTLKQCQALNLKLGVVTSSQRWMLEKILSNVGILKLFDATIASEDVIEEKPSPEPYLSILSKLAVSPEQAIVFEDSAPGIQAASKAGIAVFGIRHFYNQHHDFSLTKKEFTSLIEVDLTELV